MIMGTLELNNLLGMQQAHSQCWPTGTFCSIRSRSHNQCLATDVTALTL